MVAYIWTFNVVPAGMSKNTSYGVVTLPVQISCHNTVMDRLIEIRVMHVVARSGKKGSTPWISST